MAKQLRIGCNTLFQFQQRAPISNEVSTRVLEPNISDPGHHVFETFFTTALP